MDTAPVAPTVPGELIGPYQLIERIGSGGMGEVWSARDTRLDRMVALKFSSSRFSDRFAREARSIAALNHPGICTLYDVGPNYLVMEFIDGITLDRAVPKHGLRLGEALRYGVEIADAIAAAHAQGIVHRDLKPGNIMVTPKGRVKVLDFGLATAVVSGDLAKPSNQTATAIAAPATGGGAILGTVAYMSPEQAQGLPVDARSDIFSFGVLFYEMLTGAKPFGGNTTIALLAAVVNQEPRPVREVADLPLDIERLLSRCLRKSPDRRIQTMADLHAALVDLKEESDSGKLSAVGTAVAHPSTRIRWRWPVIAAAVVVAAAAGWWAFDGRPSAQPARPIKITNYANAQRDPALSPDGSQVAFSWTGEKGGNWDIYVKHISESEPHRLTTDPGLDRWPLWSPDGSRIMFRRGDAVYSMSALGGSERKLASGLPFPFTAAAGGEMSWSPDGKRLAIASQAGIFDLPAEGGELRAVTTPPGALMRLLAPAFSPDGRTLAYFRCGASAVSCRIMLQPLAGDGAPAGAPRQLFDKPFRAGALAWTRDGRRLIFSASPHNGANGVLWQASASGSEPPARLQPSLEAFMGSISIAGERLAYLNSSGGGQVWQASEGHPPQPLIRSAVWDFNAELSPDGKRVVFQSGRAGDGDQIFTANADGTEIAQLTGKDVVYASNPSWSPDGKWVVFPNMREDGNFDIVAIDSSGGPLRQLTTGNNNLAPRFSRDGSKVWFVSNRTGRNEIWNVPFAGGAEVQFTHEGRRSPQESTDGKTLYSIDADLNLFARSTAGGPDRKVLTRVMAYAAVDDGFYVAAPVPQGATAERHFVDLSGGNDRIISDMPAYFPQDRASVSVSLDRRRILFTSAPNLNVVVEMVDGFH
jgi:serine/threonine protein kinase